MALVSVAVGTASHGAMGADPTGSWPLVLAGLTALAGLAALLAPWPRLSAGWLHVVPAGASLLLAGTIAAHGDHGAVYSPLLVVVVAYAAYAFRRRPAVVVHAATAVLVLTAPLGGTGPTGGRLALEAAALLGVAVLMMAMRERMVAVQDALRQQAESDPLTGIGNYRRLQGRLGYEIARHQRSGRPLALLVLDLDGFKAVNDSFGHPAGDALLREVAQRLKATVRSQDTVTRQGGDEFAVLAPETGPNAAEALAGRIERALSGAGADGGAAIGASVGWAIYPADGESRTTLVEEADARQRAAKRARRAAGISPVRISA